ncbi:MAG: hypothetical protein AB7S81_03730 [Bdellovibrionales bacterium]
MKKVSLITCFVFTMWLGLFFPVLAAPLVSQEFCRVLERHVPIADVAYRAGVDVDGNKVLPADLEPALDIVPETISLPLTIDLLHFIHGDKSKFPFSTMKNNDINLGVLEIKGGQITLNGQPLTNQETENLAVLCRKAGG